jgi:polyhydroxyalkanoate synthesis repressor PhaR
MIKTRIIKKYPNRRLYDEADSRYVNFDDLKNLVLTNKAFRVKVDGTNEDQTAKLLLQIFLDLELSGTPLFSDQALRSLIVLNNSPVKNLMNLYLKNSLNFKAMDVDLSAPSLPYQNDGAKSANLGE